MSSLANEQFCYLTTPEEYSLQRYEGGNTLYGPHSQPFVAAYAAGLARDVARARAGRRRAARAALRLRRPRFLPAPRRRSASAAPLAAPRYVDPTRHRGRLLGVHLAAARRPATSPGTNRWRGSSWADGDGGWAPALDGAVPVDDQGYHVGVVHLGPDAGRPAGPGGAGAAAGAHRYAVRWFTGYRGPERPYRFVVATPDGELAAPEFR